MSTPASAAKVAPEYAPLMLGPLTPSVRLAAWAVGAAWPLWAGAVETHQVASEVGFGYESQTAPLIRLSPQGELISLDGVQRLGGASVRVGAQAFSSWDMGQGWGVSLALDASQKRLPSASEFDFGMVSVQPSLHRIVGGTTLGVGASFQRMDVAGSAFRQVTGVQGSWTLPQADGNLWMAIVDMTHNEHAPAFADLDASAVSLSVQRHLAQPGGAWTGADFSLYLARERNEKGLSELSHGTAILGASLHWSALGLAWSTGGSYQAVQFDGSVFDGETLRRDRAIGLDLAVEKTLTPRTTLQVEWGSVRNFSSIPVFENTFHQLSLKWRTAWR